MARRAARALRTWEQEAVLLAVVKVLVPQSPQRRSLLVVGSAVTYLPAAQLVETRGNVPTRMR